MVTRCGIRYPVGTEAPPRARWMLWFWEYVIYHQTKQAAEHSLGQLCYHQAEDAQILPVKNKRRR
jgi:hypothetical protein